MDWIKKDEKQVFQTRAHYSGEFVIIFTLFIYDVKHYKGKSMSTHTMSTQILVR